MKHFYLISLFLFVFNNLFSQNEVDSSFAFFNSFSIYKTQELDNGKILVAGSEIIRINSDGSIDNTFFPLLNLNGNIYDFEVYANRNILIVGDFEIQSGPKFIALLNSNGQLLNFNCTVPFNSYDKINTVAIQSNGKIVIGGIFNDFQSFSPYDSVRNILRLNSDGTTDFSFNAYSNYLNHSFDIKSIIIDATGKILIAGEFSRGILRLNDDGSIDTTFNLSTGFGSISNIKLIKYGLKTIVKGDFSQYNNYPIEGIAILDTLGQLDTTFNIGSGAFEIMPLVVLPNGNFLLSSIANNDFGLYEIGKYGQLVKFQLYSVDFQANNMQQDLIVLKSGKILVIDGFTKINGHSTSYIARVDWTYNEIFKDFNFNCTKEYSEESIQGNLLIEIQPGNTIIQSNNGIFNLTGLSQGNYTATIDTSGQWRPTCSSPISFTYNPDSLILMNIGVKNINPCTNPEISIFAPFLRRCFSNQYIYVEASNQSFTQVLYNSYADVKLDSFLTLDSATLPYTFLGNYTYRFQLDSLNPGQTKSWQISTTVSCSVQIGRTLTLQANLFPVEPCAFDSTPNIITGVAACLTTYDNSHLVVNGSCTGDSIRFVIKNMGSNMDCFMPTRMFLNNVLQNVDSVKLNSNDSLVITFLSDGRTWRIETEQHPLHPGNSHPNVTIEACGDANTVATWVPELIATLPQDDEDPFVDIFCGIVGGAFDPNDKTGYPTGVDFGHYILPNQQMQYVIRFQNTGTDTAFKVVIRDTLETDLNIFSVVSGVSSHNYSFRMYGPRILEWTFNDIMLPDSFVNEPASNGFVTFTVEQNENLPSGTSIDNSAAIYFDFNAPLITNTSHHEIQRELLTTGFDAKVSKGDVLVYPNPNNGLFRVELPYCCLSGVEGRLTICNVMGQVVFISTQLNNESIEIDLSKQPNGIYFLKVENGEMEWNKKVVKN